MWVAIPLISVLGLLSGRLVGASQDSGSVIPAESRPCVDCHAFEFMQRALQDLKKTAYNLDTRTESLLLRAEKRGLCDCFPAILWNGHWDLANGHLLIFKMLFNKLQEDTECKLCPTTRKTISIQTGIAQLDHFCFDVFYQYFMWYCICWNVKRRKQCQRLTHGFYARTHHLTFLLFQAKNCP